VLLDTSFILALENKDDPHHQRARELDAEHLSGQAVVHFRQAGFTALLLEPS
jgi:predicted nucleic acid-binding protein